MDIAKYNSQLVKDITHYVSRTKVGNVLKAEQKELTIENKKVNAFNIVIKLKNQEFIKIEGMNNEYNFIVSLNGNDVYKTQKCNFRDNEFREAVKSSEQFANFINCFESLGKIFKKKRK